MRQAQFEALVARLEQSARSDPGGYRLRVLLLALLGYAYIALVVGAVAGLLVFLVWLLVSSGRGAVLVLKLAIPLGTLIYIALRAMWVRLEPPRGERITRQDAPRLFQEAERLAHALKAPAPDVILVTSELNASVSQIPRLGIFGWRKNYLVVGLQLASALHPDLFRAVLAHEFAHLSRAHSHFAGWIYRLRMTWAQLVEMLERNQHAGTVIFSRFFNWYAPYFAAYSFVLAREYEYEADKLAASVTSSRDMAAALLVLEIKGRELGEEFWPGVWAAASESPGAPTGVITNALSVAAARPPAEQSGVWAYASLQERAGTADTHPSVYDRLTALLASEPVLPDEAPWMRLVRLAFDRGTPPEDPPVRALPRYFGATASRLAARMDTEWRDAAAGNWRARHEYCQTAGRELDALDARAAVGPLPAGEAWQRAELTFEFRGSERAEPIYRELLERHPDHAAAHLALGNILLLRGEETGVREVEHAISLEPNLVGAGTQIVTNYLTMAGKPDEAESYRRGMLDRQDEVAEANAERSSITPRTKFEPPSLPRDTVEEIVAQLRQHPDVAEAWLVRQVVKAMPEVPAHVLAITIRNTSLSEQAQAVRGGTVAESLSLPSGVNAFVLGKPHAELLKKIGKVAGGKVYVGEEAQAAGAFSRARAWLANR